MDTQRCYDLMDRDQQVIAGCQHLFYFPLAVAKGEGSILTDEDGNRYIDFLASASSLNLGSSHPAVTQAIRDQLDRFTQYIQAYCYNRRGIEYGERLVSVYPGGVRAKVCYGNSGSDCNDAAVKFARGYTGRSKIITFRNGYHGNTYAASTMSTYCLKMHQRMGPFLPDIYHFPFFGIEEPDELVERECLQEMENAFTYYLPPEEVAAVIIEPVQGDGGMLPAHPIFMRKLYELCQAHGILFISEEVQQGLWRTGKWFSIEHYGIVPDGIILGKSVGAGLPMGVFLAKAEILDSMPAPAHVFTLSGNALACAAGIAAFDVYQTAEFQKRLQGNIRQSEELLAWLKARHPYRVAFTRQLGMSMGVGIQAPDGSPDGDGVYQILYRCFETGLVLISMANNVLRIQPPLNIEPELLKQGFHILDAAITDLEEGRIPEDILKLKAGW